MDMQGRRSHCLVLLWWDETVYHIKRDTLGFLGVQKGGGHVVFLCSSWQVALFFFGTLWQEVQCAGA